MITRTQLANKEIKKLNTIEEALEMVECLTYDECLEVLKRTHNLPVNLYNALIDRCKALKGNTIELIIMSMQHIIN